RIRGVVARQKPRLDDVSEMHELRGGRFARPGEAFLVDRHLQCPGSQVNRGAVDRRDDGRHDISDDHWPIPAWVLERVERLLFGNYVATRLAETAALVDPPKTILQRPVRGLLKLHIEP